MRPHTLEPEPFTILPARLSPAVRPERLHLCQGLVEAVAQLLTGQPGRGQPALSLQPPGQGRAVAPAGFSRAPCIPRPLPPAWSRPFLPCFQP